MGMREIYKAAMRCYRTARKAQDVRALVAAVSLVRTVTGKWDIPEALPRHSFNAQFSVAPQWRVRRAPFSAETMDVITKPGKLHVMRSQTLFCRLH